MLGGRPRRRAGAAGARQPARPRARRALAVELGAASVDHCTFLTADDVDALGPRPAPRSRRCCPGVEFSTRSPYPDGRRLLDAGVSLALATDCNPGTCYSSSMPFVVALAVREMHLTPGRRCARRPSAARTPCGATTSAGRAGARADLRCWTRRRTCTCPTGRACRSRARSSWRPVPDGTGPGHQMRTRSVGGEPELVALLDAEGLVELVDVADDAVAAELRRASAGRSPAAGVQPRPSRYLVAPDLGPADEEALGAGQAVDHRGLGRRPGRSAYAL